MFKNKVKKIIISLLLIVLGAGTILGYKFMWGRPFSLDQLYTRTFVKVMMNDPETLTMLGLFDNSILDFYSDDLTDNSPESRKKPYQIYKKDLEILKSADTKGLGHQERLSYDIFQWFLQNEVDGEKFMYHNYPVNQYEGIQNQLPELLISTQTVKGKKSAENYIERLSKFNSKFDGVIEGLKLREEKGIIPPKFVLEKALKEMKSFIASTPENNPLITTFREKLKEAQSLEDSEKTDLCKKAETQIVKSVYPAYGKLITYIETLLPKANNDDGVWKLQDGEAYYAYKMRAYTTTNFTPEQVHQIGINEVARIEREMRETIRQLGQKDIAPGEFMKNLSLDSRFKYSNDEAGKAAVLKDYETAIAELDKNTAKCFELRPQAKLEVRPVPAFKQETAPQAYLFHGSPDGSKPSILQINVGKMEDMTKYSVKPLAAHESIPGHHMQRMLQKQLKGVPIFRKAVPYTAFAEGWAMYAEKLAWENDPKKDPYENLARLQSEMWRAARLVVDTGIHYKKWTREKAIAYMVEKTGMPESIVTIEVERYIVDPGQACAYKIGMMKFLELREKAKKELGDRFDIREFHNTVLKDGAMPLEILEQQVNGYIQKNKEQ
ncbi:MAG: DUF885 domain-containing protein [Clostridia bacterium]|nr:DUF885 domain-containing protein [Clostridia bacterium]